MFFDFQTKAQREYYAKMLKSVASLSKLFSENGEPYLEYRLVENLFCKSFDADNLSRSDCSADASKNSIGVGIKTFLDKNGASMQKVAEFNGTHKLFRDLDPEEKILKVSELRNDRILTTKRIFALEDIVYHCVTRRKDKVIVYETSMDTVDLNRISKIRVKENSIYFSDSKNEYSFNVSKSVLYKRFITDSVLLDLSIKILEDPFIALEEMFKEATSLQFSKIKNQEHIFLPLYSVRNGEKYVPEKSGLNQWNAGGRARGMDELYIPIPALIHKLFTKFFPPRDKPFKLLLPNKTEMSAKVCQDNSKALMSNPNAALGQWLLRDVLNLKEGELLTYERLQAIGLDSVVIYKVDEETYDIDFTRIGSFDDFIASKSV